jgi:hypothetical protein
VTLAARTPHELTDHIDAMRNEDPAASAIMIQQRRHDEPPTKSSSDVRFCRESPVVRPYVAS